MDDIAIRVERLGKRYRIGTRQPQANTLFGRLKNLAASPLDYLWSTLRAPSADEILWALKDVSFEVKKGEVVGIIGRNGAGKSTLLKILARITEPTEGLAEINGRVGSLLEVGTGFHPQLTGRENIYLNGAILGMRKAEMDRQFDEIVAFAEIDKFIDTPVKRYSSGMYVRLAFAVAAHLEPEILLVDEVLAVGDAAFQKKCLGKMGDVAKEGRTVLFVSHNMAAVRNLCEKAIWLDDGEIREIGLVDEVTRAYLGEATCADSVTYLAAQISALPSDEAFRLVDATVRQGREPTATVLNDDPIEIEFTYEVLRPTRGLRVYFDLCDENEDILIRSFHDENADEVPLVEPGCYSSVAKLPANFLAPRDYLLILRATIYNVRSCTDDGVRLALHVNQTSQTNRAYASDTLRSKLQPAIEWHTVSLRRGRFT